MCGITGIINKKLATEELIEKMTSSIEHRGPDDFGFIVDEGVALGMRRLSIITAR
jgi:asparagine synthase (glutamine-hydrolysing)